MVPTQPDGFLLAESEVEQMPTVQSAAKVKPSGEAQSVEKLFPAIAQWVQNEHIEIGDQESFGFLVRALDYGGLVFEDNKAQGLAEALVALEKGLEKWFKDEGIDLE
jgi:hypothetical protein